MDNGSCLELTVTDEISSLGVSSEYYLCATQSNSQIIRELEARNMELEKTIKVQDHAIECLEMEAFHRDHHCRSFGDSIVMWYKRGAKVMLECIVYGEYKPTTWTVNDIQFKEGLKVIRDMRPVELRIKFVPMDIASICWDKLQNLLGMKIDALHIYPYDGVLKSDQLDDYAEKVVNLMVKASKYQLEHEHTESIEIRQKADRFLSDSMCGLPPNLEDDSDIFEMTFSLTGLEQILRPCTRETVDKCNRRAILAKVLKAHVDSDKLVEVRVSLCSADCTEHLIRIMEWDLEKYRQQLKKTGKGKPVKTEYPKSKKNSSLFHVQFKI